jgi:ubiquinone/menaquinone biosynthesis C-methylase UbiE
MKLTDKLFRKFVPSTAVLSYKLGFRLIGYLTDIIPNFLYPEFRRLPPNHLRVRVGVGNNLFFNQSFHIEIGYKHWLQFMKSFQISDSSKILEIGCGCGRIARPLYEQSFSGTFTGIDIDNELIDYCQKNFTRQNFIFHLSTHESKTYSEKNLSQASKSYYSLPVDDNTQDFIYSTSLLTHLLEDELLNYVRESFRALKPGGCTSMTFFCLESLRDSGALGGRWNFENSIGNAFVESLIYPEAAVAYKQEFIRHVYESIGFSEVNLILTSLQSVVLSKK